MGDSANPAGSPAWRWAGVLWVAAQLGLAAAVVGLYEIDARNHLRWVFTLAAGGYVGHSALPVRFRPAFFVLLSAAGVLLVLGGMNGLCVLGIGGGIIAACHLPVRPAVRAGVVLLLGCGLALLRFDNDWAFWPVLGSMFMFRTIVYLHDLRAAGTRPPLAVTLAYFFPLPNVCFPFFPILDFKTFRETYQPAAPWPAAQEGVGWVVMGVGHLLLYRAVKYYVLPSPNDLADPATLAVFLAASYALYLKVSGYFHVITGVLHLYGFRVPRTHHNYFLAASFTDVWRRINIPWKDFMAKVFFVPLFFTLRGLGSRVAGVAATLDVFLVSWALHSYQVFWLVGELPLSAGDAALWLGVGVLAAVNLRADVARAARGKGRPAGVTPGAAVRHAARVVGMFALVSIFWSVWHTPGAVSPFRMVRFDTPETRASAANVVGVLAVAVGVGAAFLLARDRLARRGVLPTRWPAWATAVAVPAALAGLVLAADPEVAGAVGPGFARTAAALSQESATPSEAAIAAQGYYEEVTGARVRGGSLVARLEGRAVQPSSVTYTEMTRPAGPLLEREPIPGWSGEMGGRPLTVNSLGMRDRPDRTRDKSPGTRRLAMIGSSVVMGFGVGDDETFSYRLEDRLNADRPAGAPRVEVLNFGTGRSYVTQRYAVLDQKAFAFAPDAVFYFAHQDELDGPIRHLATLAAKGGPYPVPGLADIVRRAGVTADTAPGAVEALLRPFAREVVAEVYAEFVRACRRRGVVPVWVYLPIPGVVNAPSHGAALRGMAEAAGFLVVDLDDWAVGRRTGEVKAGEGDYHPNAAGHRLISDRLADEVRRRPELVGGLP